MVPVEREGERDIHEKERERDLRERESGRDIEERGGGNLGLKFREIFVEI